MWWINKKWSRFGQPLTRQMNRRNVKVNKLKSGCMDFAASLESVFDWNQTFGNVGNKDLVVLIK